jgi:hypothetical protein
MKTTRFVAACGISAAVLLALPAYAHAPVFVCESDNDMIRCEAGFSDGSSAEGRAVTVLDAEHRVIMEGTVDSDGLYVFTPPDGDFHVFFDGGQYHEITLYSTDIE